MSNLARKNAREAKKLCRAIQLAIQLETKPERIAMLIHHIAYKQLRYIPDTYIIFTAPQCICNIISIDVVTIRKISNNSSACEYITTSITVERN